MKRPFRQGDSTSDSRRPRPSQGHRSFRGGDEGRPSFGAPRYDSRSESGGGGEQDRGGSGGWSPRPRTTYRREGASGGWNQSSGRPPQRDFNRPQRDFSPRSSAPSFNGSRSAAPSAAPESVLVSAENLKKGIKAANRALADTLEEFGKGICGDYDISALELPVSFSADGRFLGFGKGGSLTINLTMTPLEADVVFEQLGSSEIEETEKITVPIDDELSVELDSTLDLD